jgi:hypothetical protein
MAIDATKPADGTPAVKSDLRANLQAAADGISADVSTDATTTISIDAAAFGDHQFIKILCTSTSAISVTLENDVPAGKAVEVVRYGASGDITAAAGSGASLVKPSSASLTTSQQYEAMVFEVDTNSGTNAAWRLAARS